MHIDTPYWKRNVHKLLKLNRRITYTQLTEKRAQTNPRITSVQMIELKKREEPFIAKTFQNE